MSFIATIKKIIKWFIPFGIIEYRNKNFEKKEKEKEKVLLEKIKAQNEKELSIKNYFSNLDRKHQDQEILNIIEYFDKNNFSVFPYDFSQKYDASAIEVYYDRKSDMHYIMHENKRMYFPKTWDMNFIRNYYNGLCIEQDRDSPHRYETEEYTVNDKDTIADIGAAEGIWALTYAEKASKIYLFECNREWIKALKKTFEPWKKKTFIINKYISNDNGKDTITLDDFLKGEKINCIKADIEGMEIKLLEGSKRTLTEAVDLRLLLCAYHRKNDMEKLRFFLEMNDFTTEYSKGYMIFINDEELDEPYLRRGLIRARKTCLI